MACAKGVAGHDRSATQTARGLLLDDADASAARDYQRAYRIERQAYEHMFSAGAGLAKASVTPEVAVGLDTPPERLRSALAMLLASTWS